MNYKKLVILLLALFLSINFVCAADNSTSEILDTNLIESNEITLNDNENNINIQQSGNISDTDILKTSAEVQSTDALLESEDASTKENLKLVNYTNFVKSGDTYYLYLTTSDGKAVANKKLSVDFDGTNYVKTADSNGRFGIAVTSTATNSSMNVIFNGDDTYNAFNKSIAFYIDKSISITIGNTKLLTNGYLRVYLSGPKTAIASKTVKITIGDKVFTKKTTAEGFIVFKPKVAAKTYTVTVSLGNYSVSKKIKCINGNVKNPFTTKIKTVNGVPDIDVMPGNFVMADNDAQYTLTKAQYQQVLKRDSNTLFLYGKLSKYTFFKSKAASTFYHIIKREKWNVIEQAINIKMVKKNSYKYWPGSITVNLKGKSLTYSEVRDIQNTEYTCGPTSASVCSQVLKNYFSEKYFQTKAHVTHGVNINVLKSVLQKNNFKATYFYTMSSAIKQLAKGGAALIAYLPNHYVSVIDVSKDGKKILVSNSYGAYNVGGDSKIPTNWVTLKKFNAKFRGVGLVVKLNYKLSKTTKTKVNNCYLNMGSNWARQNTNERIPNVPI